MYCVSRTPLRMRLTVGVCRVMLREQDPKVCFQYICQYIQANTVLLP